MRAGEALLDVTSAARGDYTQTPNGRSAIVPSIAPESGGTWWYFGTGRATRATR